MENHSEQVEVMVTDIKDNLQFLQSLARKVEQEEAEESWRYQIYFYTQFKVIWLF